MAANNRLLDRHTQFWTRTTLSNQTAVQSRWDGHRLSILANGTSQSVVEVGDQVAWMSTALASCAQNTSITSYRPLVEKTESPDGVYSATPRQKFVIKHEKVESKFRNDPEQHGGCWVDLFRNPIVVQGYPVPHRSIQDSGLEVSIDIMAGLANTKRFVDFGGRTFLKGFSAMFAVTKVLDNTVWWHLCLNKDMTYISYEDPRMPESEGPGCMIDITALSTHRHILGWSKDVKCLAGRA